jgi:glycosyltransferase involved in cell wall biosynthesis
MKNIAYMMDGFPIASETFIVQEILELKKRGLNIHIYARDRVGDIPYNSLTHSESSRLIDETCYLNPYAMVIKKKAMHLLTLLRHPARYLRTLYFSYRQGGETFIAFKSAPLYIKEMKSRKVEHIHAHFARRACTFSMLISMITGIPYSFSTHANDIYASDAMEIGDHIRAAKFVVTCTALNQEYLGKRYGSTARDKVHLNYHGVDTEKFTPSGEKTNGRISILSIGRLVEKKGFTYLIDAIADLRSSAEIDVSATIIGDGPQMETLTTLVRDQHLEDIIHFTGALSMEEVKEELKHADIFVLPSRIASNGDRDGIPNVILEAMSMGLPVVTTAVSGIPEVIMDGVDGMLMTSGTNEAIADTIRVLYRDESLRKTLGENARKRMISQFHKDNHIDSLYDLFISE